MKQKIYLSNIFISLIILALVSFSVSAQAIANPTAPVLGEAGRFIILASQTVTTTSGSVISDGDIGVLDQARTFITGFTPSGSQGAFVELTNGMSYASDDSNPLPFPQPLHYSTLPVGAQWPTTLAMIDQSRTDLGVADTFLAADPNPSAPTQVLATELGTLTLTRGVYKTASSVTIQTGNLTLDAQNDPNSVFIFVIGGTLTTGAPGGNIILINGARANNVYWRTAGLTQIGSNTFFKGNVFAFTQVNVITDANVEGRLLASTDQVTLQSNVVTMPAALPPTPVLTTINLSSTSENVTVGNTFQLNARGLDQFNAPIAANISFDSSNSSIATVDNATGLITTMTNGDVIINASSGTVSSISTMTVRTLPVLTTINLSSTAANLTIRSTLQLNVTSFDQFNDSINATIVYTSSDIGVANVSSSGLITANASGTATITATSGTVNATSIITVETITPILNHIGSKSVTQGTQLNFTITATSPNGFNLTFVVLGNPITANFTDNLDGTATFIWNPISSDVGVTNMNFTVTDGIKSASEVVSITVNTFQAPTTFTTFSSAQLPVDLGTAGNFVILTKSGISTTGTTSIVGDIGVSPIDDTAITGFGLIGDETTDSFKTSALISGKVYAANYVAPTPVNMGVAVNDMEIAYTDAAGRTNPTATELNAGNIGGLTLAPGLYKWGTGVTIPTDVTLDCQGDTNAVYIFQIAQTLDISSAKQVILSGGCQAKNIFWQVAGATTLGTNSVFNGNILDQTNIAVQTGATLNGRALAQTAVTLDANAVSLPNVVGQYVLANVWRNANYNITLNATEFNNSPIAYINYTLNGVSGQIIGNYGNILINTNGNNTLVFYAVDTSGNVESPSTLYAMLDVVVPTINSFTLSATNVEVGNVITGTCIVSDNLDTNIVGVVTGIDTSSAGSKTAKCTATDAANNIATATTTYTVNPTPSGGGNGGGGGGGSGSSVFCTPSYQCGDWGTCVNSVQARMCVSLDKCSENTLQTQSCLLPAGTAIQANNNAKPTPVQVISVPTVNTGLEGITGAAVGNEGKSGIPLWVKITALIVVAMAAGIAIVINVRKPY